MDIQKQFKLPAYTKGKSFSEASEMLQAKIRDKETLEEMMSRLRDAQEYVKEMQAAQEAQANPEMAQQQMGEQMSPEMMQGQGGQPQMDPAMMEQMMAQQQGGGQQQFAMGGAIDPDPTDPIVKAAGSGDKARLRAAGNNLNNLPKGISAERQALFDKVQSNGGSFLPNLDYKNENIGHTFQPLQKHLLMQTKIDNMNDPNKSKPLQQKLDRAQAIYKQQMGRKAYVGDNMMNNIPTEELERRESTGNQFAMGGYSKSNDYFLGGLFGKGKTTGAAEAAKFTDAAGAAGAGTDVAGAAGADLTGEAAGAGGTGPGPGGYMAAASAAMDFGMDAFGKAKKEDMNNISPMESQGGAAVGGAMKGAQAGMDFGPYGAAVGGVLGGASAFVGAGKRNDARFEAKQNVSARSVNMLNKYGTNSAAKGGYVTSKSNSYSDGGQPDFNLPFGVLGTPGVSSTPTNIQVDNNKAAAASDSMYGSRPANTFMENSSFYNDAINGFTPSRDKNKGTRAHGNSSVTNRGEKGERDWVDFDGDTSKQDAINRTAAVDLYKENQEKKANREQNIAKGKNAATTAGRYAPVGMNAYQLATMSKPEVEKYNRLDKRYKPQYMDEKRLMNEIDAGFNPNAATEGSGGSLGRFMQNSLAMNLNKMKARGKGAANIAAVNAAETTKAQAFDKDTDMRNNATQMQETIANAKNRASYDTTKSNFLSAIGENVGGIAKENFDAEQAKEMYGYDRQGDYVIQKDGTYKNSKSGETISKEKWNKLKKSTNQNMFGGFLNKK